MRKHVSYGVVTLITLISWCFLSTTNLALAQDQGSSSATASSDTRSDEVNHDVQLYLLVASSEAGERGNVPQSMEAVIKQLKAVLPFSGYRLAATFLNRVRDGGSLDVSGVGGSPLVAAPADSNTLTFFNFGMSNVKLVSDTNSQPFIRVVKFRFGLKIPVVTATTRGEGGTSHPVIQYQDTGISTEMSVREGMPTVVGTLAANRLNESFVLVVNVKRASTR